MPKVGFPRSSQETRKTQDTPIPAVLGKTLTDYENAKKYGKNNHSGIEKKRFSGNITKNI